MRIAAQAYLASKPECQINKRCKAFCIDGLIPPCENNLELIRVYSIVEVARATYLAAYCNATLLA